MHIFFAIIGILFLINGIMTETSTVQQQTVQTMHFMTGWILFAAGSINYELKEMLKNQDKILEHLNKKN